MDRIRYHLGRHLYYIGFRILPANMRRGVSCMTSLGMEWAKKNPDQFQRVVDGKDAVKWEWVTPPLANPWSEATP